MCLQNGLTTACDDDDLFWERNFTVISILACFIKYHLLPANCLSG